MSSPYIPTKVERKLNGSGSIWHRMAVNGGEWHYLALIGTVKIMQMKPTIELIFDRLDQIKMEMLILYSRNNVTPNDIIALESVSKADAERYFKLGKRQHRLVAMMREIHFKTNLL